MRTPVRERHALEVHRDSGFSIFNILTRKKQTGKTDAPSDYNPWVWLLELVGVMFVFAVGCS